MKKLITLFIAMIFLFACCSLQTNTTNSNKTSSQQTEDTNQNNEENENGNNGNPNEQGNENENTENGEGNENGNGENNNSGNEGEDNPVVNPPKPPVQKYCVNVYYHDPDGDVIKIIYFSGIEKGGELNFNINDTQINDRVLIKNEDDTELTIPKDNHPRLNEVTISNDLKTVETITEVNEIWTIHNSRYFIGWSLTNGGTVLESYTVTGNVEYLPLYPVYGDIQESAREKINTVFTVKVDKYIRTFLNVTDLFLLHEGLITTLNDAIYIINNEYDFATIEEFNTYYDISENGYTADVLKTGNGIIIRDYNNSLYNVKYINNKYVMSNSIGNIENYIGTYEYYGKIRYEIDTVLVKVTYDTENSTTVYLTE